MSTPSGPTRAAPEPRAFRMEEFKELRSTPDYITGKNVVVVYHDNCHDGITAAWAASHALPDASLYAATYGAYVDFERFADKHVLLVDFCWPPGEMRQLLGGAHPVKSLTVLDHHVTAYKDVLLPLEEQLIQRRHDDLELPYQRFHFLYDVHRSGAGITWDVLFETVNHRHRMVDLVEDRDLWRFSFSETREFHAYADTLPLDIASRNRLAGGGGRIAEGVLDAGRAILRYQDALVGDIARHATIANFRVTRGHEEAFYEVPVIVLPTAKIVSEVLGKLTPGFPFAVGILDTAPTCTDAHVASVSLRSAPNGAHVGDVAKAFGGGGHEHASGFTIKRAELDARIFPTGRRVFPV